MTPTPASRSRSRDRSSGPAIAVLPEGRTGDLIDAVASGGGDVGAVDGAQALVWTDPHDPAGLARVLDDHRELAWIQLPWAGIEPYAAVVRAHADRTWTCGKGVYAEPVAEHALALALAGRRHLGPFARAGTWTRPAGDYLLGTRVTIVGGGGITESLLRLLAPFRCDVTVVRRSSTALDGARVVDHARLDEALSGADVVVLALALVPETEGLIDRRRLALLAPGACLVNVARGSHVVTDDLVDALRDGTLGSAGIDVADPEPLPDGHPLWDMPNVIVTPHTANTPEMAVPLLAARVTDNVRRWLAGESLVGLVDPALGY